MKLAELKAAGGFVPSAPIKKSVTWKRKGHDDVVFDVRVKRQSFGMIERTFMTGDDDRSNSAAYIADSILLGDKGSEAMTYEDAYQLEPSLAKALIDAINAVNGTGADPKN
jgi:hypothetical protein